MQHFFSKKSIALICLFSIFAVASAVFAEVVFQSRCVPCKLNHYCIEGLRFECPDSKPVTKQTGGASENDCFTCNERNGDTTNPKYDLLHDDCVSCYEYNYKTPVWTGAECKSCYAVDNTKPVWNGTSCEACPSGETPNSNGVCTLASAVNECEAGYITIDSADELAMIGVDSDYPLNGKYCQMKDISLAAYGANYNNGEGWTPIGNYSVYAADTTLNVADYRFSGIYDGNNKTITDLYISRANTNYQSLFGLTHGGIILRNIHIKNANVTGKSSVGTLLGNVTDGYNPLIKNCSATGVVNGTGSNVGGLVGRLYGKITDSHADVEVTGNGLNIGGLIGGLGWHQTPGVVNCYATGNVKNISTSSYTGGLMGATGAPAIVNSYATGNVEGAGTTGGLLGLCDTKYTVSGSYATGNVTGVNYVGGLIGTLGNTTGSSGNLTTNRNSIVSECYATGTVIGHRSVGGLIGTNNGTIQNSYAINFVTGQDYTGGIAGVLNNTIINSYSVGTINSTYSPYGGIVGSAHNTESITSNSFFDSTISNLTVSCGGDGVSNCTTSYSKTTAEMQTPQTFIDAGWDESIWELVQGQYPKLKNVGGQ